MNPRRLFVRFLQPVHWCRVSSCPVGSIEVKRHLLRLVITSVLIPLTTPSDQVKTTRCRRRKRKRGNARAVWLVYPPLLLPTPTILSSLDRKRRIHKRNQKKMETFWFFRLRFRRAYDSAYDSDFWFSQVHKGSYDPLLSIHHESKLTPSTPSILEALKLLTRDLVSKSFFLSIWV